MKYRFFQGAILKDVNGDNGSGSNFKPESVLVGTEGESLADYVNESSKQLYSEQQANKDLQEIHDEISELSIVVDDKLVSFAYLSNTIDDPNGVNINAYYANNGTTLSVSQFNNRFQWNCRVEKDTDGKYYLYADYWLLKQINIVSPSSGAVNGIAVKLDSFNETISNYLLATLKWKYGSKYQNLLLQFSSNQIKSFNVCGITQSWSAPGNTILLAPYVESFNLISPAANTLFKGIKILQENDPTAFNISFYGTIRCLITFNE